LPGALEAIDAVKTSATSAVHKGVASGHASLAQVQGRTTTSLAAQQGAAEKGLAATVVSTRSGIAQIGKGAARAVQAQHAAATTAQKANAAQLRTPVRKAYISEQDAGEVAGELKGGLRSLSSKGIVAAGKTAKDAAGAASAATKGAKSGLASQSHAASSSAAS